ncbi:MAG: tetratricopeptide repeat protein [Blastochloris sp.]|nr:tetratricopeptide repeat protein [Blastochloris sp.]
MAAIADPAVRRAIATGVVFEQAGLMGPAVTAYRQAAESVPQAALAQLLLGRAELRRSPEAGVAALEAALKTSPDLWSAHRLLGDVKARKGAFKLALAHFEAALAVFEDAESRLLAGSAAEALGDDNAARTHYERTTAMAPDSFAALNQYAWFLAKRGQSLDLALKLAERADALRPGNASVLDTKGWILFRRARSSPRVTPYARRIASTQGDDPRSHSTSPRWKPRPATGPQRSPSWRRSPSERIWMPELVRRSMRRCA